MTADVTLADFKEAIKREAFKTREMGVAMVNRGAGGDSRWIFDFRAVMLQPRWLNFFAETFWETYKDKYPFQVAGLETAGIPLVAAIVMKSIEKGRPVNGFFIRKSRKRDGLMKVVEGTPTREPVILVDDLMNSGQTFNKQIVVVNEANIEVSDIFAILAFREKSAYRFATDKGIGVTALFTIADFGLPLLSSKAPEVPQKSFEVLWRFKAENPSFNYVVQKSAPAIDDARVYFGADNGTFFVLNQENGSVAWKYTVGFHPKGKGIFSSPALHEGRVYFGAYDGNVYCLNAENGKREWVFMEADWIGSSPSIAPDLGLLYVGLEFGLFRKRGGIAALSLETGKKVWDYRMPEYTHSSPLYIKEEHAVVVGGNEETVYCFDAKSGELRWTFKTEGDVKSSFAYDSKRRLVLFGSMGGRFYALNMKDGSPVFVFPTGAGIYSTPLIVGDVGYVASLDKNQYAIDLSTGKEKWKYAAGGRIFASPALADGSLWIGSNDGRLYELDPHEGKLKRFLQLSERIVNSIAYNSSSKRFFVPTVANEMYCVARTVT